MDGIRTEKLNIGYRSDLIRDISLKVRPGEIVTLIGPNGCGKTTLLKTLTGELKKRGGTVYLNDDDRDLLKAPERAKRMSLVMTHRIRPGLMTCREVVEIGRYPYVGRLGILSEDDRIKVREAMEWTDSAELAEVLFTDISDGQRQRVLLARAICQEPEILILDEPVTFLDIRHKIDIMEKIRDFAVRKKTAVLMSLHELDIARNISDTVVCIGEGKILRIGRPDEVFKEDFIRKLYNIENIDTGILGPMPWKDDGKLREEHKNEGDPAAVLHGGASVQKSENHDRIHSGTDENSCFEKKPGITKIKKARVIMIQGTMSNVGKSVIAAGLCRIFSDDGFKAAPFKSQNMALNSYITDEGLEMGRAQVMQAECARTEPLSVMNPILLKPTGDEGSQVIVNGRSVGNMTAAEYFRHKREYVKDIMEAFEKLSERFDVIVVEGAGSPVEMNLKADDIVNMGLAQMIDAPVLLVGDIDRGGIFAQILGTLELLQEDERKRVKGLIVNKFRGDASLFDDGIRILEEKGKTRVAGVVPFMKLKLDDEDSLSERFEKRSAKTFDIAVLRLEHISNFTDFDVFEQMKEVSVRYVKDPAELGDPDIIIIPGSKNTLADLAAIKENGMTEAVIKSAGEGTCIFGICGGFQMLGRRIEDPYGVEEGGSLEGLGLLPVDTVLEKEKVRTNRTFKVVSPTGILEELKGIEAEGYEIHMGKTEPLKDALEFTSDKTGYCRGNVYGTYMHGFFDKKEIVTAIIEKIAGLRGKTVSTECVTDHSDFKESQYVLLAKGLRESLDMEYIYNIMGLKNDG